MKRMGTRIMRAISLMLAVVMVVTAIPQTATTVYGAQIDESEELSITLDSEVVDEAASEDVTITEPVVAIESEDESVAGEDVVIDNNTDEIIGEEIEEEEVFLEEDDEPLVTVSANGGIFEYDGSPEAIKAKKHEGEPGRYTSLSFGYKEQSGGMYPLDVGATWNIGISDVLKPSREGYKFDGWDSEDGGPEGPLPKYESNENLTYEAEWVPVATFDANGGIMRELDGNCLSFSGDSENGYSKQSFEIAYDYDRSIFIASQNELVPVKDGYVFAGWFDENGNRPYDISSFEPVTYTAKWKYDLKTPIIDTNYGTDGVKLYTENDKVFFEIKVLKDSYKNLELDDDAVLRVRYSWGAKVPVNVQHRNGTKIADDGYYYVWNAELVENLNEDIILPTYAKSYGSEYLFDANTKATDIRFWLSLVIVEKDDEGSWINSNWSNVIQRGDDLKIDLKYVPAPYKVKFENGAADASGEMAAMDISRDASVVLTENAYTREGYIFNGWKGSDGKTYADKATVKNLASAGGEITLTAQWKPITYTVKFHSNYPNETKETVKTQKLTYGVLTALTSAAKNGFKQTGISLDKWNTQPDGTGEKSFADEDIVENLVTVDGGVIDLYAQWKVVDYVIFFDSGEHVGDDLIPGIEDGTLKKRGMNLLGYSVDDLAAAGIEVPHESTSIHGYLQSMRYGEEINLTGSEYVRRGYTLSGWKDSKTSKLLKNGKITNLTTTPECITLTAQWTKNNYTVKYNLNGGAFNKGYKAPQKYTVDTTDGVADTGKISLPNGDNITKKGYVFGGWYANTKCEGAPVDALRSDGTFELDLASYVLYAKWIPVEYTVKFDVNTEEGTAFTVANVDDITLKYDETAKAPSVTRDGYSFTSWCTDKGGAKGSKTIKAGTSLKNLTTTTGDVITYYALWKANKNTVKYNLNGGKLTNAPANYETGSQAKIPVPTKAGYTFAGWDGATLNDTDSDGIGDTIPNTMAGNLTLSAKWTEIEYYISVNNDADEKIYAPDAAIKYSENIDFATLALDTEVAVATGRDIATLTQSIVKFTTEPNGKGKSYKLDAKASKLSKGNTVETPLKLYAVWSDKSYHIEYDLNDDVTLKNPVLTYKKDDKKNQALPKPTRVGCIFEGWKATSGGDDVTASVLTSDKLSIIKGAAKDIRVEPVWSYITYTVKVDYKGGTDNDGYSNKTINSVSYATDDVDYKVPIKEGYIFQGINTKANGTGTRLDTGDVLRLAGLCTSKNGKVTVYAIWAAKEQNITYELGNVSAVNSPKNLSKLAYDKSLKLSNPTLDGYTFAGWTTETEGANITVSKIKGSDIEYVKSINKKNDKDITLTANWTVNSYTLTIDSNGGFNKTTGKVEKLSIKKDEDANIHYDEVINVCDLDSVEDSLYARYEKKGYVLVGFAADSKGASLYTKEQLKALSKLSAKNKGKAVIYAVWEKVSVSTPLIEDLSSLATGKFSVVYSGSRASAAQNTEYEIQYCESINFRDTKSYTSENARLCTIDELTSGKTYFVRVREIRTDSCGNKTIGSFSTVRSVEVQ